MLGAKDSGDLNLTENTLIVITVIRLVPKKVPRGFCAVNEKIKLIQDVKRKKDRWEEVATIYRRKMCPLFLEKSGFQIILTGAFIYVG